MAREDSSYPADWFRVGDKEFKRAGYLLAGGDLDGAGYNIQQALEKYFKGYLISKGWKLRKIHDLETLLNAMIVHDPSFEDYRTSCIKITQYYLEERYPSTVSSDLSTDEINASLNIAEQMISKINKR